MSAYDYPVFCALDSIKPSVVGELADFTFVESVHDTRLSALSRLPFVGAMWYARPACEYLLHSGICTWDDFKWSFQANSHIPAASIAATLELMEKAWSKKAVREKLPKLSMNCMIGLWAVENLERLSLGSLRGSTGSKANRVKMVATACIGTRIPRRDHIKNCIVV
jgi:hypothetical protein